MQRFIGTKIILATAMTLGAYNEKRGWPQPKDEDPNTEGYLVEYTDGGPPNHPDHKGYISWSPKAQFEGAYRQTDGLTFGHAVEALKMGKRVARRGWEGKGLFVFMQVPANIPADVIPKMTSLPESVKHEFARRQASISYSNQFALVKPDNQINGWAPSSGDALAEDWLILEDDTTPYRPPHQQRVLDEKAELDDRAGKLDVFIASNPIYSTLPTDEQMRLLNQLTVMRDYSLILRDRIAAFPQ